ncbi:MAG: hypothetical protein ACLSUW_01150 [Akkermansia sp.]
MPCLGIPGGPTVEVALDKTFFSLGKILKPQFQKSRQSLQPLIGCKGGFLHLAGFIMASNILTKRYLPKQLSVWTPALKNTE